MINQAALAKFKNRALTEDQEHANVMNWARSVRYGKGQLADVIHHSPNGGKRDQREGAKFKRMGVQAGFPDFFVYVPMQGAHGLFVELKAKKGTVSENQKTVLGRLDDNGYKTVVCYGFDHARRVIADYLGIEQGVSLK